MSCTFCGFASATPASAAADKSIGFTEALALARSRARISTSLMPLLSWPRHSRCTRHAVSKSLARIAEDSCPTAAACCAMRSFICSRLRKAAAAAARLLSSSRWRCCCSDSEAVASSMAAATRSCTRFTSESCVRLKVPGAGAPVSTAAGTASCPSAPRDAALADVTSRGRRAGLYSPLPLAAPDEASLLSVSTWSSCSSCPSAGSRSESLGDSRRASARVAAVRVDAGREAPPPRPSSRPFATAEGWD